MLPLVIGGDHSAAIGSIAASAQGVAGVGIVWVDAHPDFNTPETTPSGNIHGMVLAIASGRGPALLTHLTGLSPMVPPERIVVVGARSVEAAERINLREAGVRVYDSEYVERHGVRATAAEAMAYLAANRVRAIHLSVDVDVLNPADWPGVSTPAQGGLTADELSLLARIVAEKASITAMDLVELTPAKDSAAKTAEAGIATAVAALAGTAGAASNLEAGLSAAYMRSTPTQRCVRGSPGRALARGQNRGVLLQELADPLNHLRDELGRFLPRVDAL
jgi:arginase